MRVSKENSLNLSCLCFSVLHWVPFSQGESSSEQPIASPYLTLQFAFLRTYIYAHIYLYIYTKRERKRGDGFGSVDIKGERRAALIGR